MKEKEFNKKFEMLSHILSPIYYNLDDEGNVVIDEEEMRNEFEHKLNEILEVTK